MNAVTLPLSGKIAIVTGGSRSIGAAIAQRLAADGAAVAITYNASPDRAAALVEAITAAGGRAISLAADAGDPEAVRAAVSRSPRYSARSISWSTTLASMCSVLRKTSLSRTSSASSR